jgi:NitT/TauT family transport system substrate-binding protein
MGDLGMFMHRRCLILACALVLSGGPALAIDKVMVGKVGAGSTPHWPLYIAIEKGFFQKRGIAVDQIATPSNPTMLQQIAAGSLDVGISAGSPDPIRAAEKGAPAVILRIDCAASPYALTTKSTIGKLADLKGKTISIDSPKGITRAYLDRLMEPIGLKEGDFDLVFQGATPARLAALKSGSVDAAMLTSPFDSYAEAQGFKTLVLVNDLVKDIPFSVTVANKAWVENHKQTAKDFEAAINEAVAWFYDVNNRTEAIAIAVRDVKMQEADVATTYAMFHKIDFFNRSDTISRRQMQSIANVLIKWGDIQKPPDLERLLVPDVTRIVD